MKSPSAADLSVFLCTAQHLNFSKAAIELGLTPSALSHSVKALENRLGVRLFNRTHGPPPLPRPRAMSDER